MGVASGGRGLSYFSSVEKAEESEVSGCASSKARLWVWDLVAEVLVDLWSVPRISLGLVLHSVRPV